MTNIETEQISEAQVTKHSQSVILLRTHDMLIWYGTAYGGRYIVGSDGVTWYITLQQSIPYVPKQAVEQMAYQAMPCNLDSMQTHSPSTSARPSLVGTNCPEAFLSAYSLCWMVLIWPAIVASVPIPLRSISPIKSDSDIATGAVVCPVKLERKCLE